MQLSVVNDNRDANNGKFKWHSFHRPRRNLKCLKGVITAVHHTKQNTTWSPPHTLICHLLLSPLWTSAHATDTEPQPHMQPIQVWTVARHAILSVLFPKWKIVSLHLPLNIYNTRRVQNLACTYVSLQVVCPDTRCKHHSETICPCVYCSRQKT